jgi:predicted NBD/HSP70 family sugar kinase
MMSSENKLKVFNLIRKHGPISRAEIAKLTKLSAPTVGRCVNYLIKKNFLKEIGVGESSGGRKPILVEVSRDSCFTIGVEIGRNNIRFVAINPANEIIGEISIPMGENLSPQKLSKLILSGFNSITSNNFIDPKKIIGMGIGIAGVTSKDFKKLLLSANFGWMNISLSEELEKILNFPIFLDNRSNLVAYSEYKAMNLPTSSILLGITVGRGIGGGLIVEGKIFRGFSGGALEAGHTVIDFNGPKCSCGRRGCAEALASIPSILKSYNLLSGEKVENIFEFKEKVESNNKYALEILKKEAFYLSVLISNLVNTFNPSHVVIGGEIEILIDYLLPIIEEKVKNEVLVTNRNIEIKGSSLKDIAAAYGAAVLAMEEMIEYSPLE